MVARARWGEMAGVTSTMRMDPLVYGDGVSAVTVRPGVDE